MTMTWPEFHPIIWVPLSVLLAMIGTFVARLLFADKPRPMHMGPERRARVGKLDGQPWQIRAIAYVGIPGAIAMFLTWALVTQIQRAQTDHSQMLKDHVDATTVAAAADVAFRATQERQAQLTIDLLRGVCYRLSKSDSERKDCLGLR